MFRKNSKLLTVILLNSNPSLHEFGLYRALGHSHCPQSPSAVYAFTRPSVHAYPHTTNLNAVERRRRRGRGEDLEQRGCICGLKMIRWLRWRHAKLVRLPTIALAAASQLLRPATMWLWPASKSPRVLSSFSRFFMRVARHRIRFSGYAPEDRSPGTGSERGQSFVRLNRSGYIGSWATRIWLDVEQGRIL